MRFFLVLLSILSFGSINNETDIMEVGQYQNGDIVITYGQTIQDDGDIDGAIYFENINKEMECSYIEYDDLGTERFIYLADVGNQEYIAICERYYNSDGYQLPVFKDVILIKYDIKGNRLGYINYNVAPISYNNHNNYLVIRNSDGVIEYINSNLEITSFINLDDAYIGTYQDQYQGVVYINEMLEEELYIDYPGYYDIRIVNENYEYEYTVAVSPIVEIRGTQFEDMYLDGVTIFSLGEIYINGSLYFDDEYIMTPGNYTITIYGLNDYIYQKEFTLLPSITYNTTGEIIDFIDGLIVNEPVKIYSNGISMFLNGEPYYSERITEPGIHEITIYGINGMQYTLSFIIMSSVTGVVDGGVYESVNFTVYGECLLNGEVVTGDIFLDKEGNYKLEIIDNNEIYEMITFDIESISVSKEDSIRKDINFNYVILVFIAVGGYLILRKK